ncbi:hypothetical protein [Chitiniphilus shinanonensis]|uniref:hypothetical protein n=1 Tax=Chitiniphilus shinanonensis TaxID=553088 RepID=UPI00302AA275
MTIEQDRAFRAEQRRQIQARTQLLASTRDQVVAFLQEAQAHIARVLASQPTDYQRWQLTQVATEIDRILADAGIQAGAQAASATTAGWQAGLDFIDRPLEVGLDAGGVRVRLEAVLPRIDVGQLNAMREFMVDRIQDITAAAGRRIRSQLGLVVIGAQDVSEAITQVENILGGQARRRATTIVRTELGRVHAVAAQTRLQEAAELVPMEKRWRRSGKIHSRLAHDLADGQTVPADQPYIVNGYRLMHPHDPKAPAAETINCGCLSIPRVTDWPSTLPTKRPFTDQEIALDANKRAIADALTGRNVQQLLTAALEKSP